MEWDISIRESLYVPLNLLFHRQLHKLGEVNGSGSGHLSLSRLLRHTQTSIK